MTHDPNVPETSTLAQALDASHFQIACRQAAATLDRPECNGRLPQAIDLVLAGAVARHDDGTATVKSGSHTYHLEPECTCQDAQHRSKWCKHFLAVELLKRTTERLHQAGNSNGPQPETQPPQPGAEPQAQPPQAEPWQCAQAPSSCTLKWVVGGIELLLTLRAADDQQLFNRIGRILPRIEEKLASQRRHREQERHQREEERQPRQAEEEQAQPPDLAAGGNGGGRRSSTTTTTLSDDDESWCARHEQPMDRHTKHGDVWYSHRTDDGPWCRGA